MAKHAGRIGLLAAEAVAVVITVELVARGRIRRVEPPAAARRRFWPPSFRRRQVNAG